MGCVPHKSLCGPPLSCTIIAASLQHWAAQPAPKHQPYVLLTPSGLKLGHRAQCGASSNYGKYGLGWTQFCEQRRVCSCAFYFDTRIWEKVSRLKKKIFAAPFSVNINTLSADVQSECVKLQSKNWSCLPDFYKTSLTKQQYPSLHNHALFM